MDNNMRETKSIFYGYGSMELRLLRYFMAVAEEGHITRAAERLGMQQPPLSQQIKRLEGELGLQLFRRKPRGVALTGAGRAFLADVREIMAGLDRAADRAQRAARGEVGTLSIGIASTAHFCPLVPRVIRAFREAAPQVQVELREGGTSELVELTRSGTIDMAFVRKVFAPGELAVERLLQEPMVLAMPQGHALARGTKPVPLKALAAETFVFYRAPEGPGLTDVITSACQDAGFVPRYGQAAPRPASALNFVAAGHGVTIVPQSLSRMSLDGVSYRRIAAAGLVAPLNIVSRRSDRSETAHAFLQMVRRAARS
jgi:DNA-binding transcriptional LysR family regulator